MWVMTGAVWSSLAVLSIFSTVSSSLATLLIENTIESPTDSDVRFFLWTKRNPSFPVEIFIDRPDVLAQSGYSSSLTTKILIHEFNGNFTTSFAQETREAYLNSAQDVNIIAVDWAGLALTVLYETAFRNARSVGSATAQLVDFLVGQGTPMANVHLIGFSLGAHVAGWAGSTVKRGRIGRITGLDPAKLPSIAKKRPSRQFRMLKREDAQFVDVIHTNGKALGLGLHRTIGHADFYPNGGTLQPECILPTSVDVAELVTCNHVAAYRLFTESIRRPGSFLSTPCSSYRFFLLGFCGFCPVFSAPCNSMGEFANNRVTGKLYLRTRSVPPYSLN